MEGDSKGILIKTPIQESLRMAKLMVMAFISGGKKKNTMGSGKRVWDKAKGFGKECYWIMSMLENGFLIELMDMGPTHGQMVKILLK